MLVSHAAGGVALALAALAASAESPLLVYALVVGFELAHSPFRPAQAALVPSLARTPEELTAANAVASTIQSVGMFAGPALGGLLLAATDPAVTLGAISGFFLLSSILIALLDEQPREAAAEGREETVRSQLLGGLRMIAGTSRVRLLIGVFAALTLSDGILFVLIVPLAFDLLATGDGGVGALTAALGVGAVVGSLVVMALLGRAPLSSMLRLALVLWAIPVVLLSLWTTELSALVLLAIVGLATTSAEVTALTLLQRTVPDDVLARVFGVLESVGLGCVAVGALMAPILAAALGTRGALASAGAFVLLVAAIAWSRLGILGAASAPTRQLELLHGVPIFAPLPASTLSTLASKLVSIDVSSGARVIRQGDPGHRFYVVDEGRLNVDVDGVPGEALGPGSFFGEIALLHETPRSASITAATHAKLYALERGDFIAAVTGHAESKEAADAVIATRLRALRPSVATG